MGGLRLNDYVIRIATYAIKKYKSRNPSNIIKQRMINFTFTENLVDTLGFYTVVNNRHFIRLSAYTSEIQPLIGARHELSHDFCDRSETAADGFDVLKGAMINPKLTASCPDYTRKTREQYAGKIDAGFRTAEDILFQSPSFAANFV